VRSGNFLNLSDYQLLKDSAPWRNLDTWLIMTPTFLCFLDLEILNIRAVIKM
jgi:hypothetical protein